MVVVTMVLWNKIMSFKTKIRYIKRGDDCLTRGIWIRRRSFPTHASRIR